MTTKRPSELAAGGPADDPDSDQITKEHNDDGDGPSITVDPSEDVTVEATEDVTTEAVPHTPPPSLRPGTVGVSAAQRAPTLLGVPIQSLPLPGVTAASAGGETTRTIDYDDEITVLAQPAPADPLSRLDDVLDSFDRPSITDDDEEETKVEPAEAAMKAAESMDDVTTALSAQASLEREKALRRAAPAPAPSDDLEFADPEAEDDQEEPEEESLDDELDDDDEVISAGGAVEEEEDVEDADDTNDGVATATFMKPADSTGLSGLLNPRRPPTGSPFGRDGYGSARLPTPYPTPSATVPAPSTSPFASRLGPAPTGSPYSARQTGMSMPAIQIPAPSGAAATASEPGFLMRRVSVPGYGLIALVIGVFVLGAGVGGVFSGKKTTEATTAAVAKPPAAPSAPTTPVVEPVHSPSGMGTAETKATTPEATVTKPPTPTPAGTEAQGPGPSDSPSADAPEAGLWKPTKKPAVAPKPKKVAIDSPGEEPASKPATPKPAVATSPKPAVATSPKPAVAMTPKPAAAAATPKPAVAATPKPAAAPKAAKKPAKVWVDPFAN